MDKYGYAYFDTNGKLVEFILDPSVRQGNSGINKIYVYWERPQTFGKMAVTWINTDIASDDTEWSTPEVIDSTSVPFVVPAIQDYDPIKFKYGKTYTGYLVEVPEDALAEDGNIALSLVTFDDEDNDNAFDPEVDVLVMWLGIITFYVEQSGIKFQNTITQSQFFILLNKFAELPNKFVTLDTQQKISALKSFLQGLVVGDSDDQQQYVELYQYNGNLSISTDNGTIVISPASIYSSRTDLSSLGTSDYKWKDLWLSGLLKDGTNSISISEIVKTSGSQTIGGTKTFTDSIISSSILARLDNTHEIGSNGSRFKKVYTVALGDGTNSINVADIPSISYVNNAIATIQTNTFVDVDATEYPTLEDFLDSEGEEGHIYLYPINVSDLSEGYYKYIWERNDWRYIGSTAINLANYVMKTFTIAGIDMQDNITAQELTDALIFMNTTTDIEDVMED